MEIDFIATILVEGIDSLGITNKITDYFKPNERKYKVH